MARKLIKDPSPEKILTASKRSSTVAEMDRSPSVAKKRKLSDDDELNSSMSTNSFYGKKPSKYLTPLDRKARRESSLETDRENTSQSSTDENEGKGAVSQNKGKKSVSKQLSNKKGSNTVAELKKESRKANVLKEITKGSPRSPVTNVNNLNGVNHDESPTSDESPSSDTSGGNKRFFKSRTPVATKSRNNSGGGTANDKRNSSSGSKMTKKGLKMLYKPASMKNKVTPSSPDIKLKKRALGSPTMVRRSPRKLLALQLPGRNSSTLVSDSDSSSTVSSIENSPRRSPRKRFHGTSSQTSAVGSEELFSNVEDSQNSGRGSKKVASPTSLSSGTTDSVRLLSEVESETNASGSPGRYQPSFNDSETCYLRSPLNCGHI